MDNLKSEKVFKEYLKDLSDDTIIQFYHDVEWTIFPVLVLEEYKRRFKRDKSVLEKIKIQTELAKSKSILLQKLAKNKGTALSKIFSEQAHIAKRKSSKAGRIAASKSYSVTKMGERAGRHVIKNTKTLAKSQSQKNLDLLEKLSELYDAKIITRKEFLQKKKELLSKI